MFNDVLNGLVALLDFWTIVAMVAGTCLGICLGALPGIGATLGIALAIPFTYGMGPLPALACWPAFTTAVRRAAPFRRSCCASPARPVRSSRPGTAIRWPSRATPAAPSTCRRSSCAVGGSISALSLILLAPPLAKVALAFGPPEIFWVNVFGLVTVAAMLGDDMLKGVLAACFGLLIGTIGLDNVSGHERYTFGLLDLVNGISVIAVMVGMFSLPAGLGDGAARSMGWSQARRTFKINTDKGFWKFAGSGGSGSSRR